MFIVDSHNHIWSKDSSPYYYDADVHTYMSENSITMATQISMGNEENQTMLEIIDRYPGKFIGVAHVDLSCTEKSLIQLRSNVEAGKVKGVKLYSYFGHYYYDDPELFPIYETALELDIPVLVHCGWSSIPFDSASGNYGLYKYACGPVEYANVLDRFPGLKLILSHLGGNDYWKCITIAERYESIMFDTAWLPFYAKRHYPEIDPYKWIEHAVGIIGANRIMFGGEGVLPKDIINLDLSDADKEKILGLNAKRLFNL